DRPRGLRRGVQRDTEVPVVPAGPVAVDLRSPRGRDAPPAEDAGAELVSRSDPARALLGRGARLPSHRAHLDELRAAGGAPAGRRGGSRGPLRAPPPEPS